MSWNGSKLEAESQPEVQFLDCDQCVPKNLLAMEVDTTVRLTMMTLIMNKAHICSKGFSNSLAK